MRAVLGGTVAWHAETDPAASAVLARHHPGVPNHGDITVMDWAGAEPVDVLTAGWPCQPWSAAGKRRGVEDERAIWPEIARAVRDLRPRLVVLENVSRVVAAGELARAVGDLAGLGYVGSWRSVRAADVGAPHRRERVFIVAADADGRALRLPAVAESRRCGAAVAGLHHRPIADPEDLGREGSRRARDGRPGPANGSSPAADTTGDGRGEGRPEPARLVGGPDAALGGRLADDAPGLSRVVEHGERLPPGLERAQPEWGAYEPAIRRWEQVLGRPASAPTVAGRRGARQLSPWFVEWLMGLPQGYVCATEGLTRNDCLRLLGNGVVWQQGAAAIRSLLPTFAGATPYYDPHPDGPVPTLTPGGHL